MAGSAIAVAQKMGTGRGASTSLDSASKNQAKAVSVTKKRSAHRMLDDKSSSALVPPFGKLCIALYRSKRDHKASSTSSPRKDIWWPALRFSSIADFQKAMEANLLRDGASSSSKKSLKWSSDKKKKKHRKKLVQKVLKETYSESPIETLCYLGRPLEDYVTADDAMKLGIQIQDFNQGIALLSEQVKLSWFPRMFLSQQDSRMEDPTTTEAPELFRDFFDAFDEAVTRHNDTDDSEDDSDDSDSEDDEPSVTNRWALFGQNKWKSFQMNPSAYCFPSDDQDAVGSSSETEASPKPLIKPMAESPRQQREELEDDENDHNHPPHHDDHSVAQSAAAVSYTEASLMSASKGGATVANLEPGPPELSDEVISEGESFESIWHKHQMEGWDRYLHEDVSDGSETMVYEAPNGYKFDSHKDFCDYLSETFGFCGSNEQCSPQKQSRSSKPRGRSVRPRQTDNRASSRSRSRSRSQEHGGLEWSELWLYLTNTLNWTYAYAGQKDMKLYGMSTTALWFRPGFNSKHRGELGRDHFISEDSVLKYCQDHGIKPPSRDTKSAVKDEASEFEESEPEESEPEDDDSSTNDVPSDDPGYATPDDQSTIPQDPGKPRLPTPGTGGSSASGESSGGSYYSYDNDPDRYVFSNLWQRLKNKGWSWCKAKNCLDDYWYIRPASIRPEAEWIKGVDYFVDEEDVIEFVRQRDLLSMKDREKRRRERMRKQQEDLERAEKSMKTTKPKPAAKKKSRGKSSKENTKEPQANKKRQNSNTEKEDGTKSSKKYKSSTVRKRGRNKSPGEGFSCEDNNLLIDTNKSGKAAPWARDMPRCEHKLCLEATGMQWLSSYYYLPGESHSNFTVRFQSVEDVVKHYALKMDTLVWASGGREPSNEEERSFHLLIRYALVPGLQSRWPEIRKITRSETLYLLKKLGYKCASDGASWEPPEALVVMGHLKPRYESLESLCEALRSLDGNLQSPPSAASRRRKQEMNITPTQLMALRLRIAEGFSAEDEDDEEENQNSVDTKEDSDVKRKRKTHTNNTEINSHGPTKNRRVDVTSPKRKSQKTKANATKETESEEEPVYLTPPEKKMKEFADDEEQQLAMSPAKIKVGKYRKNPEDNTAPWAINPPNDVPKGGWHNLYTKMGFGFQHGEYYLPGETSKSYTTRFSRTEDIQTYICTNGNYNQYLDKLDSTERKIVKRHLDYGNVPGNAYEWRKLRELSLKETVLFLNLLGFEKLPGESGWQIPEGVPILEERSYASFADLNRALIRLPDLEDRTMGMGNRRRSRKKEDDMVLSDYQMMALRLRLAEGFQIRDESNVEVAVDAVDVADDDKPLIQNSEDALDQLAHDPSKSSEAWKALKHLGCDYSSGRYSIRGHPDIKIESQNQLIEIILRLSVKVLDWEQCTLDSTIIRNLEEYLRTYHARNSDTTFVKEALTKVTKGNIRNCLGKVGIQGENGTYNFEDKDYSERDIINMIRRTKDLNYLMLKEDTPVKRRRTGDAERLTKLEAQILRIWAVFSDTPLENMPNESLIGRAKDEERKDREEDTDRLSQAISLSEVEYSRSDKAVNDSNEHTAVTTNDIGNLPTSSYSKQKPSAEESKTAKKLESEFDLAQTPVQKDEANTDTTDDGKLIDLTEDTEQTTNTTSTRKSGSDCNQNLSSTSIENSAVMAETTTETNICASNKNTESASIFTDDADQITKYLKQADNQSSVAKGTPKFQVTNLAPATESAAQIADLLMKSNRGKSFVRISTPSSRKNPRELSSSSKKRQRESPPRKPLEASEGLSKGTPGFNEFFTPRQHNGRRPSIREPEPLAAAMAPHASPHPFAEESMHELDEPTLALLTQPSFGDDDDSIRTMDHSAELDFDPPQYSPISVNRKRKASQHYGSRTTSSSHGNENEDFFLTQDWNDPDL